MDEVHERLSLETVESHSLLVCEHVLRYEFAARFAHGAKVLDLACGSGYGSRLLAATAASVTGVDVDVGSIEAATYGVSDLENVGFEAVDAVTYLRKLESDSVDLIVCFEGLEHLTDLSSAVRELRRLTDGGTRLVVSVPNSEMWEEDNPYHVTDFSLSGAQELFTALGDYRVFVQNFAEGSMIVDPQEQVIAPPPPELRWPERVEWEYANHYLAAINIPEEQLSSAMSAKLQSAYAPTYNRHVRNIEHANASLWKTNARLAWAAFTHSGAAAATRSHRERRVFEERDRRIQELETEVEGLRAELERLREEAEGRSNRFPSGLLGNSGRAHRRKG